MPKTYLLATLALAVALAIGSSATTAQEGPARPERWQNETSYAPIASGPWTGKRRADGQPDIEGHWSNTIANHDNFTDPQGGSPGTKPRKSERSERAPSRVTDPADGQIPYQPWARAKQQEFAKYFSNPIEPRFIEPLARCAPAGVPKSLYWHGYEIRQFPGHVLFIFGSGYRLIRLGGAHYPDEVKLWNADSRGHWEGNTLVVDVANNNSKALFGRTGDFASENVKITERYIFNNDNTRYNYVATFDDPSVYTRPWTATIPARRWSEKDPVHNWHYEVTPANLPGKPPVNEKEEQICNENNSGFGLPAATLTAR